MFVAGWLIGFGVGLWFGFIGGMIYANNLAAKRQRDFTPLYKAEPIPQPITNVIPFRRKN
jgi:hypothetical protein